MIVIIKYPNGSVAYNLIFFKFLSFLPNLNLSLWEDFFDGGFEVAIILDAIGGFEFGVADGKIDFHSTHFATIK